MVKAIAKRFDIEFSKVKIGVDLGTAIVSGIISLIFLGRLEGVGIGTIISAFGVGLSISFFEKTIGQQFAAKEPQEV